MTTGIRQDTFQRDLIALIPRLQRYALGLTGSTHDRDDLVQNTLERAMQKRHQWRSNSRLDGWVFSILNSIWKNEIRSRSVRRGNGVIDVDMLSDAADEHALECEVLLHQVQAAVTQLPDAQRAAVLLVDVEGFSYGDAASALGIPIGTLMSRLARGRNRLLEKFETPRSSMGEPAHAY